MSQAEKLLEWKARIAEFRASGLSGSKWCEKNGFRKKQFYYWLAYPARDSSTVAAGASVRTGGPRQHY
ncbi:MAG: hypothetical protein VB144_03680 [Clostridia bacterium]|nr:hypothetical protein [Clostridia bacterium]